MRNAERVTYDFDDAIYLPGNSHFTRFRGGKVASLVSRADTVIVGNDQLADWACQYSGDVRIIPTCVDPADYQLSVPPALALELSRRVVWLGSPSSEPYLRAVSKPLARFLKSSGMRLDVVSSGHQSLGDLAPYSDRVEWELGIEARLGAYCFGIAPLVNTGFALGKSAYKLIQYACAGLPFIASPVGTNASVTAALGGWQAESEAEWTDVFHELRRLDEPSRAELAARMSQAARGGYSYASWRQKWCDAVGVESL